MYKLIKHLSLIVILTVSANPVVFAQDAVGSHAIVQLGETTSELPESFSLSMVMPEDVGFSSDGLGKIEPAMQAYLDDGRLAGIVTMVARRGQIVHWNAIGSRDLASGDPLEKDDIFRIYSMTKPVTSVATMMLVEEGLVELDDDIADYIPELGGVTVLTEAGERVPADAPITIRNLLTHTSGLTYGFFGDTEVDRLYRESNFLRRSRGLDNFIDNTAELPLLAHPGDRWNYSISMDVLGKLIEVVSGQGFDDFVAERITEPLGMDDTAFLVPPDKRERFMANYGIVDGQLVMNDSPVDGPFTRQPNWLCGGCGLVSSPGDYIRFAQMLLNEGELDGVRLLQPGTVRAMRTNQLPDQLTPITLGNYLSPGYGFGLGMAVLVDEDSSPEPDNNGVFRWAGAANTYFWIDPEQELIGMVWTQVMPFTLYPIEKEFQTLVYEAMVGQE